jgi:hypothetical protein
MPKHRRQFSFNKVPDWVSFVNNPTVIKQHHDEHHSEGHHIRPKNIKSKGDTTGHDDTDSTEKKDVELHPTDIGTKPEWTKLALSHTKYRLDRTWVTPMKTSVKYTHTHGGMLSGMNIDVHDPRTHAYVLFSLCNDTHTQTFGATTIRTFRMNHYNKYYQSFLYRYLTHCYNEIGFGFNGTFHITQSPNKKIVNLADIYYNVTNYPDYPKFVDGSGVFTRKAIEFPHAIADDSIKISYHEHRGFDYNKVATTQNATGGQFFTTSLDFSNAKNFKQWWDLTLPRNYSAIPLYTDLLYTQSITEPETFYHTRQLLTASELVSLGTYPAIFSIFKKASYDGIETQWNYDYPLIVPFTLGQDFIHLVNSSSMISMHSFLTDFHPPSKVIILGRGYHDDHADDHGHENLHTLHLIADEWDWNSTHNNYTHSDSHILNHPDIVNYQNVSYT